MPAAAQPRFCGDGVVMLAEDRLELLGGRRRSSSGLTYDRNRRLGGVSKLL